MSKNCSDSRPNHYTCRHGFVQAPVCHSNIPRNMEVTIPPCCSEELMKRFHPSGKPEQPEECRKDIA